MEEGQHKVDDDPYAATNLKSRKLQIDFNQSAQSSQTTLSETLAIFNDQFSDRLINLAIMKNPFLSRSVHLTVGPFDFPQVLHFLESFGPFIWSLKLRLPSMNDNRYHSPCRSLQYTMYIMNVLQSIPNIRRLQLSISWSQTLSCDSQLRSSEITALTEFVQNYSPPPRLMNLKVLHFEESGPAVLKGLLENWYAPQLSAIHYADIVPNDLGGGNLEYISLQMSAPFWNKQIEAIESFKKTSSLKKLYLYIFDEGDPYLENLFEVISVNLASSLQVLIIQWRRGEQYFPEKLHLPKLKTLELRDLNLGAEPCLKTALQFLADLQGLRSLKIQWSCQTYQNILLQKATGPSDNDFDKVDLLQYIDKLDDDEGGGGGGQVYESNIWRKLSKLDKISFKTWDIREEPTAEWNKVYTRWEWSKVYTRWELCKLSNFK